VKRFKNISLIYECDKSTVERAALLAKENRAKLTIVYPVKETPVGWDRLTVGQKPIDVQKLVQQEYQARLKEVANSVKSIGVRPATRIIVGEPFLEIIRDVIENERDLVIMTAEGKGGMKERLFGSTSTWLMRKCPAPVLVLKPSRVKRFRKILAAIDPQVTGDAHDSLNGLILELASSLSTREDAELHIVHAWSLFGESQMRRVWDIPASDMERALREEANRRKKLIQTLRNKHSVGRSQLHLLKGEAADAIPKLVKKLGVDLLIIGTICRVGIPGFIIGNTAERVLGAVDCSVLTVKPEGFVSPVAAQVSCRGAIDVNVMAQ